MRKNNGESSRWLLSTVKKAFRSRKKNKRRQPDKRSCTSDEDLEQEEVQMRRRKRRWSCGIPFIRKDQNFGTKSIISDTHVSEIVGFEKPTMVAQQEKMQPNKEEAITTAAAAAEVAVTTPQAAMEFKSARSCILDKEYVAAVIIQKFFRGYVARIALRALKGVVKLQALIRGDNVRKRTALTLRKMQALLRLQTQLCEQRRRLLSLHECSLNSGPLSDKVLMDDRSSGRDLACTFYDKSWNYNIDSFGEDLDDDNAQKLRETIQWGSPISYPCAPRTFQEHKPKINLLSNDYQQIKTNPSSSFQKTSTKSSESKHNHLNFHSTSPNRLRHEELLYKKPKSPHLLTFSYRFNTEMVPSYMAETASTKARARSQSVPKERRPKRDQGMPVSKQGLFIGSYEEFGSSSSCRSSPLVKR